ncbi:MAG: ATP-binding cassette domain-containing protein [Bacteroidales bacterium]|nr:ATP-binding cassette domain-containing protein [Bacteroidales bacterium]
MKDIVLSIRQLTKRYGSITAVDHLDLEIEKGSVFGILGPNGSGKTTTLGMLLDVVRPDSGSFTWFGGLPDKEQRKRIGAILEVPLFYPYLTGRQNLELIARIKDLPGDNIDDALDAAGLADRKHSRFRTYSLGMKQRLAVAATLLGKPEVLILDEPTNGLDPRGIAEIRDIILHVAAEGVTILLASHILDEVQKTCTHVAVLEKGKKLFTGPVEEVLNNNQWIELSSDNMDKLDLVLRNADFVANIQEESDIYIIKMNTPLSLSELNKFFYDKGIILNHLAMRKQSLEKYFLELLDKS